MTTEKFRESIRSNFKFRLFMLKKLPATFFSGLKLTKISEEKAVVTIPFKYLTKNPFNSMYFASQAMAAELSTGVLAMAETSGKKPRVSMLVLDMKANFTKKATTKISFTCNQAKNIKQAIDTAISSGEGVTITVKSIGTDLSGEKVSEFYFTWTFKQKNL